VAQHENGGIWRKVAGGWHQRNVAMALASWRHGGARINNVSVTVAVSAWRGQRREMWRRRLAASGGVEAVSAAKNMACGDQILKASVICMLDQP